jgi:hypothetical protein
MKYARKTPQKFPLEKKKKTEKIPVSGVMCARGIASPIFQIPAVYCHFHGDASPSITCRKNIGADKILPVDRLIANLFGCSGFAASCQLWFWGNPLANSVCLFVY